jgi:hypothetical protein
MTQTYINHQGRIASVEKHGRQWEGWFEDDHSVTYIADTKAELICDMGLVGKLS